MIRKPKNFIFNFHSRLNQVKNINKPLSCDDAPPPPPASTKQNAFFTNKFGFTDRTMNAKKISGNRAV